MQFNSALNLSKRPKNMMTALLVKTTNNPSTIIKKITTIKLLILKLNQAPSTLCKQ